MRNIFRNICCALLLAAAVAGAQNPPGQATRIKSGSSLLGTPCNYLGGNTDFFIQTGTGVFYCKSGTWQQLQDSGAAAGVSSFTGDGTLITNSGSTGGVTVALGTAGAHRWWGNNTSSTAAPGYETIGTGDLPGSGSTTVNGTGCTLGSSCTVTAAPSGTAGGDLSGTYPNPAVATSTTQSCSDNSTKVATTAYVTSCAGAGGTNSLALQTNGIANSTQALLNLAAGSGISLSESSGTVTMKAAFAWGGDGSDGPITADGTSTLTCLGAPSTAVYTLTRDCFFTTFTVNANDGSGHTVVIKTNNYVIYGQTSCTVNGTISNNGATGSSGSNGVSSTGANGGGATASAGSNTAHYPRFASGIAGTNGGSGGTTTGSQAGAANVGNNASSAVDASGSSGSSGSAGGKGGDGTSGVGGASRSGGTAGSVSLVASTIGHNAASAAAGFFLNTSTTQPAVYTPPNGGNGGAAGGSGGGGDTSNSGGGGGGGGAEGSCTSCGGVT